MTIFRFSVSGLALLPLLSACGTPVLPSARDCPDQGLSPSLIIYAKSEDEGGKLAQCLTENSVKLSVAQGSNEEVAKAATTGCQTQLSMFEVEAGMKRFERGDMNIEAGKEEVRREAERFALSRVVQVRAGACTRKR